MKSSSSIALTDTSPARKPSSCSPGNATAGSDGSEILLVALPASNIARACSAAMAIGSATVAPCNRVELKGENPIELTLRRSAEAVDESGVAVAGLKHRPRLVDHECSVHLHVRLAHGGHAPTASRAPTKLKGPPTR